MSITDFLLARIAEDEAAARAAIEMMKGPRWANDGTCVASGEDAFWVDGLNVRDPGWVAGHIARHDPARVLAECAAKRAIMELHAPVDYSGLGMKSPNACTLCGADRGMHDWEWMKDSFPCPTIRTLAAVYADHDEYQDEWRVGA